MSQGTRSTRRWMPIVAVLAVTAGIVVAGSTATGSNWDPPDFTVKLEAGDIVGIVPPSSGGGGTTAPVYSAATGRHLADFTTDIQSGPNIFALLGEALATGTSRAETVNFALGLRRGTLNEQHTANVAVLAESPSSGYEYVVAVIGEGIVQPGTGVFEDASGTSSLFLVFEVDADEQLPPVIRTGTLRFDID